jgi:hypothetical protein
MTVSRHPSPPKGRSYVVTNAGWGAVDAGGVGADVGCGAGQWIEPSLVSTRKPLIDERRSARTAKPCGPGRRCYGQAVAEVRGAQPGEAHRQFAEAREARRKIGSRESAAYAVKPLRREGRVSAALYLRCALRVHRSARRSYGCQPVPGLPCALCFERAR